MKLAKLDTDNLAEVYMKTMGASESDWLIVKYYVRNLALLVSDVAQYKCILLCAPAVL